LIQFQQQQQQQQETENNSNSETEKSILFVKNIVPNCTLLPGSIAFSILEENLLSLLSNSDAATTQQQNKNEILTNFFASLVEIKTSPPRFVELPYKVEYDPQHNWYGLCASRHITKGEIVFHDEVTAFTIVTKPFVEANWSDDLKVVFSRYGWPLDSEGHLYAVWSEDPQKWRPINHCCDPNIIFAAPNSLNCIATRDIPKGQMLTLDYATFCDYTMKPFQCRCGTSVCRGLIEPTAEALAKYGKNTWLRAPPKKP
jgi:hypothetical protein